MHISSWSVLLYRFRATYFTSSIIDYYWLHSTSMRTAPELRLLKLLLVKAGTKSVTPSIRRVSIP